MEFTSLILPQSPQTKNVCRTCLTELNLSISMNLHDFVEFEFNKVKVYDVLEFLGCIEKGHNENWPQNICGVCVDSALTSYKFKLSCIKANSTLSQLLVIRSSSMELQRPDIDAIDINVVYQDHEYDVPLFNNHSVLDMEPNLSLNEDTTDAIEEIQIPIQPIEKNVQRTESEKKYPCSFCTQSFTRIYGLREHMDKHSGSLKFLCSKCGKCFSSSGGLRQHSLSHEDRLRFKCSACKKMYKSRQSLREHVRVAHTNDRYCHSCTNCGKTFTSRSTLMMHMKAHMGIKEFSCPDCPKSYTRASYLRIHRKSHNGQQKPKPFNCNIKDCDRNFTTNYSL